MYIKSKIKKISTYALALFTVLSIFLMGGVKASADVDESLIPEFGDFSFTIVENKGYALEKPIDFDPEENTIYFVSIWVNGEEVIPYKNIELSTLMIEKVEPSEFYLTVKVYSESTEVNPETSEETITRVKYADQNYVFTVGTSSISLRKVKFIPDYYNFDVSLRKNLLDENYNATVYFPELSEGVSYYALKIDGELVKTSDGSTKKFGTGLFNQTYKITDLKENDKKRITIINAFQNEEGEIELEDGLTFNLVVNDANLISTVDSIKLTVKSLLSFLPIVGIGLGIIYVASKITTKPRNKRGRR